MLRSHMPWKSIAAGTLLCIPLVSAHAQADSDGKDARLSNEGDVIVVTAQKREERLIDVPLSITAIGEAEIESRGAAAIEDLQYSVPGLAITQFSPGQQRVSLRGISVFGGLPIVGVYLDELPLNTELNQTGQDVRLLDIDRIEVLRGPQGTLYGQGSLGGTIRYITNDVDLDDIAASAGGEIGFIDGGGIDWKTQGMVNLPFVTDRIGARFAASYQRFGGWINNPLLGEENVNSGDALTMRGKLKMVLSDRLDVSLMLQHQDLDLGAANLSDDNQQVFDRVPTPVRSKATLVNAIATYDLGGATLLSSTGYIARRDDLRNDFTNSFVPILEGPPPFGLGFPPGTIESIAGISNYKNDIFTQEVRIASDGAGPFTWTLGGFYRDSEARVVNSSVTTPDVLPPDFVLFAADGTSPEDSQSWAVFGEAGYAITPALTGLVGLRYFEDERVQSIRSAVLGAETLDQARETFETLSPRFNLSWQPNDTINLYANVAKGFRSGGFNRTSAGAGLVTIPQSFNPETLWTYEAGGKFQSSDRSLSAELAIYRNEWSDVQSLAFAVGLPVSYTVNGGELAGWGVDAALNYRPIPSLTLALTAGWNNMEYVSTTAEHIEGDPADYVPSFTGSASAEYRFDLGALPAFARLDYQYSDAFQVFVRTFQTTPAVSDEQHVLNARVGVDGENWSAALFARNILNRDSIIYPAFGSLVYPSRQQPRVIGASFSLNY